MIFPALYSNVRTHWNKVVVDLSSTVLKIFQDLDSPLYMEVGFGFGGLWRGSVLVDKNEITVSKRF